MLSSEPQWSAVPVLNQRRAVDGSDLDEAAADSAPAGCQPDALIRGLLFSLQANSHYSACQVNGRQGLHTISAFAFVWKLKRMNTVSRRSSVRAERPVEASDACVERLGCGSCGVFIANVSSSPADAVMTFLKSGRPRLSTLCSPCKLGHRSIAWDRQSQEKELLCRSEDTSFSDRHLSLCFRPVQLGFVMDESCSHTPKSGSDSWQHLSRSCIYHLYISSKSRRR